MFIHLVCRAQVGGWHVSQFLKQALSWRDQKEAATATTSSLDASHVKQRCRWEELCELGDKRKHFHHS